MCANIIEKEKKNKKMIFRYVTETHASGPITVEVKKRLTEQKNSGKVIYIERTGTAKCLKNFVKSQSKHQ